jgi:putative nucleotidyltransferase with HDIG domain
VSSLAAPRLVEAVQGDSRLVGVADTLRDRLKERIDAGALELPLLPEVASEVIALTSTQNSDSRRLAEVIRRDASMSAHVLKLANSPLYRPRSPIVSLQQALSRLGMTQIRQIALTVSCKQRVFRARGYEAEVHRAFRHCFAAALLAQELARVRRWNVEEAFLAGLLHDVGRPILLQAVADIQSSQRPVDRRVVLAVVGELHSLVGVTLARKWSLPVRVAETIGCHHDPLSAGAVAQLAMLTSFADDLSHVVLEPNAEDEAALKEHPMLPHLNLYPEELATLLAFREDLGETLQAVA